MNTENSKIVYAALSRMSDDRDVIKRAFTHWQSKFGDSAQINVLESVELIETFLGLDTGEKKVLMMSMHAASSKESSQLKAVPEYILGGSDQSVSGKEVGAATERLGPPHVTLSEGFFEHMMAAGRKRDSGLAAELEEALIDEGLEEASAAINSALKSISRSDLELPNATTSEECKDFCHAFYMLVCDFFGPMAADEMSYKAVAQLLETPEASRFDPRELI